MNFPRALHACNARYWDTIRELAESEDAFNGWSDNALDAACGDGNLDMIRFLVSKGADVSNGRLLGQACIYGQLPIIQYLVEECGVNPNDEYVMCCACMLGSVDILQYIVEHGCDVHTKSDKPLETVAYWGYLELIKYLVSDGCKIPKVEQLKSVILHGQLDIIKYFEQECGIIVYDFLDRARGPINVGSSVNAFLYMTRKFDRTKFFAFRSDMGRSENELVSKRLLILVNFIRGTVSCSKGSNARLEWKDSEYYDSNLGMLICSYID